VADFSGCARAGHGSEVNPECRQCGVIKVSGRGAGLLNVGAECVDDAGVMKETEQ